ncbi:MAG: chemotaxis protein CheB [Acidobacteriota bacterium]
MTAPRPEAVVVGASAGALDALSILLPALPHGYPLPILMVIHLPPDRKSAMADLLRAKCRVDVREAEEKEPIEGGTVYLAPPDYHLLVESDRRLSLSSEEPVNYSRPAIDVLFETAADTFGAGLVGVVLTGANSDGARGLRAVTDAGGVGLVERPDTAYAPIMPRAALGACPNARALSLEEIAAWLIEAADRA